MTNFTRNASRPVKRVSRTKSDTKKVEKKRFKCKSEIFMLCVCVFRFISLSALHRGDRHYYYYYDDYCHYYFYFYRVERFTIINRDRLRELISRNLLIPTRRSSDSTYLTSTHKKTTTNTFYYYYYLLLSLLLPTIYLFI